MKISGPFDDIRYREIGGGFGFAVTPLDDGRVVTYMIMSGSPAAKAGIEPGATILTLSDKSTKDAALAQAVLWTRRPVSTSAQRTILQFRYLSRARVGTKVDLVFKNPGSAVPKAVTLTAVDDHFLYLDKSQMPGPAHEQGKLFTHNILASRIGYIAIFGEDITRMPEFESILR